MMSIKTAIVHDWFNQYRGGEKVAEAFLRIYPDAEIFTSVFVPDHFKNSDILMKAWEEKRIHTSFLQKIFTRGSEADPSFMLKFYKHLFWIFPYAMNLITVKNFQRVIVSSVYCGKNVKIISTGDQFSLSHYCHTPTRFLHNLITKEDYSSMNPVFRILFPVFKLILRKKDLKAADRLNKLGCKWMGNSGYIKSKIEEIYQTSATVVFPIVERNRFRNIQRSPDHDNPFFLCHGAISFQKRIDLAIKTCLKLNLKLKISGASSLPQDMIYLKNIVKEAERKDPSKKGLIEILGKTSDSQLKELISGCQAFLFPGREDFGIAPIEMIYAGVPLIAYKAGGAMDYVKENINGIFFDEQTVESMSMAVIQFQMKTWDSVQIKDSMENLSFEVFKERVQAVIEN